MHDRFEVPVEICFYYIHTEKYSPKSYAVNFRTQISSSQSEERTMVFTREKIDTSNQNRERCFFHVWEKWYVQSKNVVKPQMCVSSASSPPPYIAAFSAASQFASHTFNEKSSTQRVFLVIKVKNISEMEWNSFVCFTVDKEKGRDPAKQQRKGKTERDVSFCCAFYRSYFAFHLSLSLYWNRPFYLNLLIFNCALRTNS